jgi:hypothetical protein
VLGVTEQKRSYHLCTWFYFDTCCVDVPCVGLPKLLDTLKAVALNSFRRYRLESARLRRATTMITAAQQQHL